ncbi:MAG TPA: helix-turn-helix transcriptional regulator [Planctomycetota bacterium]|nr:helix-turn-helix transcriptional regulator [Planctomycetota bacterium]
MYPALGSILRAAMGSRTALHTRRYRAFLARLRRAREEAGLTQVEVARRVGRPQTWVSKCELGERRVDFVELEDLAAACGKPLEFFATRPRG